MGLLPITPAGALLSYTGSDILMPEYFHLRINTVFIARRNAWGS